MLRLLLIFTMKVYSTLIVETSRQIKSWDEMLSPVLSRQKETHDSNKRNCFLKLSAGCLDVLFENRSQRPVQEASGIMMLMYILIRSNVFQSFLIVPCLKKKKREKEKYHFSGMVKIWEWTEFGLLWASQKCWYILYASDFISLFIIYCYIHWMNQFQSFYTLLLRKIWMIIDSLFQNQRSIGSFLRLSSQGLFFSKNFSTQAFPRHGVICIRNKYCKLLFLSGMKSLTKTTTILNRICSTLNRS